MSRPLIKSLADLAEFQRSIGKPTLGGRIDEAVSQLTEAEQMLGTFPTIIFEAPGQRSVVGGTLTGEYAARLGDWMRRRDEWMKRIPK